MKAVINVLYAVGPSKSQMFTKPETLLIHATIYRCRMCRGCAIAKVNSAIRMPKAKDGYVYLTADWDTEYYVCSYDNSKEHVCALLLTYISST